MSTDVAGLKARVLTQPRPERHELVVWIDQLEANCGDVPDEVLDQLAAEIWDQDFLSDETWPVENYLSDDDSQDNDDSAAEGQSLRGVSPHFFPPATPKKVQD